MDALGGGFIQPAVPEPGTCRLRGHPSGQNHAQTYCTENGHQNNQSVYPFDPTAGQEVSGQSPTNDS